MQEGSRNFAVFLMGQNFLVDTGGHESLQAFFITVRVEEPNEDVAASAAIKRVRSLEPIALALSRSHLPEPTIEVRVVHELPESIRMKDTDLLLFPMSEFD
nr:putative integron gene cassette protein [uncultured bacterium]